VLSTRLSRGSCPHEPTCPSTLTVLPLAALHKNSTSPCFQLHRTKKPCYCPKMDIFSPSGQLSWSAWRPQSYTSLPCLTTGKTPYFLRVFPRIFRGFPRTDTPKAGDTAKKGKQSLAALCSSPLFVNNPLLHFAAAHCSQTIPCRTSAAANCSETIPCCSMRQPIVQKQSKKSQKTIKTMI
jgi:hypothetical protein